MRDEDLREVERDPDGASDLDLLKLVMARVRAGHCASCGNEPVAPMTSFARMDGASSVPICDNCARDLAREMRLCRTCRIRGAWSIRTCASCGVRGCGHVILPDADDFYATGQLHCRECEHERPLNPSPPPQEDSWRHFLLAFNDEDVPF